MSKDYINLLFTEMALNFLICLRFDKMWEINCKEYKYNYNLRNVGNKSLDAIPDTFPSSFSKINRE